MKPTIKNILLSLHLVPLLHFNYTGSAPAVKDDLGYRTFYGSYSPSKPIYQYRLSDISFTAIEIDVKAHRSELFFFYKKLAQW